MRLATNLLQLSERLAFLERTRPKQATLRRSISTAYYAAFHLVVEECTRMLIGASSSDEKLRSILGRSLDHRTLADIMGVVSAVRVEQPVIVKVNHQTLEIGIQSQELKEFAEKLRFAYQERLLADYDTLEKISRVQAYKAFLRAQTLFRLWRTLKQTQPETLKNLAACLMFRHK